MTPLLSVSDGTSAQVVTSLLATLFPDARTAIDLTYGKGKFWDGTAHVAVTGLDLNAERNPDIVADFTATGLPDTGYDVAIFDPPYQWDMGRGKPSVMGAQFSTYASEDDARAAVQMGTIEAMRLARLGIIVKVQNYIHASRLVHMTRWVEDALPYPLYDELHLKQAAKLADPKWTRQLSVWRNHTTFLVFRKDGPIHRARGATVDTAPQIAVH